MAFADDPNRRRPGDEDPETAPREEAQQGGVGNISTTRLGIPSWVSVLVVAVVSAVAIILMLRSHNMP
jgi:hypothetical protein